MNNHDFDDDEKMDAGPAGKVHHEFHCPACDAHNPYDHGYRVGDEINCFYCGIAFEVKESNGKLKFKEA